MSRPVEYLTVQDAALADPGTATSAFGDLLAEHAAEGWEYVELLNLGAGPFIVFKR